METEEIIKQQRSIMRIGIFIVLVMAAMATHYAASKDWPKMILAIGLLGMNTFNLVFLNRTHNELVEKARTRDAINKRLTQIDEKLDEVTQVITEIEK